MPCETCGVDRKGPELVKNNDDPTEFYSSIFNFTKLFIFIYKLYLVAVFYLATSYCLLQLLAFPILTFGSPNKVAGFPAWCFMFLMVTPVWERLPS